MTTITFNNSTFEDIRIERCEYPSRQVAFHIWAPGGRVCDITVNIPHATPEPGCIFVKTWSENTGLLGELERIGFGTRTGRTIPVSEHAQAAEMRVHPVAIPRHADDRSTVCHQALTTRDCPRQHDYLHIDRLKPRLTVGLLGNLYTQPGSAPKSVEVEIDLDATLAPESRYEPGIYLTADGATTLVDAWSNHATLTGSKRAWDRRELDRDEPITVVYTDNDLEYIDIETWRPDEHGAFNLALIPWPDHYEY